MTYFMEFYQNFSNPLKSHANRKREMKIEKKILLSLLEIFQGFQNFFFYSSIKTRGGVVFYVYTCLINIITKNYIF